MKTMRKAAAAAVGTATGLAVARLRHSGVRVPAPGPEGYQMFKEKDDGCVRAVFRAGD